MLIVVVIIWILATALIPRLVWAQSKARDASRKVWMTQWASAIKRFFDDKWKYPAWYYGGSNTERKCMSWLSWDLKEYISDIPKDPQKEHKNFGAYYDIGMPATLPPAWCSWEYVYRDNSNSSYQDASFILSFNPENQKNSNKVWDWVYYGWSSRSSLKSNICNWVKLTSTPSWPCETSNLESIRSIILWDEIYFR